MIDDRSHRETTEQATSEADNRLLERHEQDHREGRLLRILIPVGIALGIALLAWAYGPGHAGDIPRWLP